MFVPIDCEQIRLAPGLSITKNREKWIWVCNLEPGSLRGSVFALVYESHGGDKVHQKEYIITYRAALHDFAHC